MGSLDSHLKEMIDDASRGLASVTERRMFGCDAWFANGNIYSLVWDGRIAVKITDGKQFDELRTQTGAEPWNPMKKTAMAHWILVPESFHDDEEMLSIWV